MNRFNQRQRMMAALFAAVIFFLVITIVGAMSYDNALATDFTQKNLPPSAAHIFGTDWMGRDMLLRTLCGLSLSLRIGAVTSVFSALLALFLGCIGGYFGRGADTVVSFLIDLFMGIPHILLLILISFACGRGARGVIIGITFSHWMSLSRVLRGEVLQLKGSIWLQASRKLGVSPPRIIKTHILPHILPQFLTGLLLLFPHAILHEASITFLGFGLSPEQPAIGIILAESMRYLSAGMWWLALFPGLMLVLTVVTFDIIGRALKQLTAPATHQD